jgi:hypothetical protein
MIRVFRITVVISDCLYVLLISSIEPSACLFYVFELAIHSFNLVYATFSYLPICGWGTDIFCIVFFVNNSTFICVSLKSSVIFHVFFPLHVKMAFFAFWCRKSVLFLFAPIQISRLILYYIHFLSSVSYDSKLFFPCFFSYGICVYYVYQVIKA